MELTQESLMLSERKVITNLLQLYKHHPCLWNTNHTQYASSEARKQALLVLVDTYKLIVQDANTDTLKRKLENMRASYKRELKKVLKNKRYKPSLWYYEHMTFLDEGATVAAYQSENEEENYSEAGDTSTSQICHVMSPEIKSETYQTEESTYNIRTDELSEPEAFGRTVGLQLSELTPMQKIIAEKLISDVIYYARLEKLNTNTKFTDLNDDYL